MLTSKEVQEKLQISRNTLDRLVHAGKLPSYKIGTQRRYKESEVEQFVNSCLDVPEVIYTDRRRGRKSQAYA